MNTTVEAEQPINIIPEEHDVPIRNFARRFKSYGIWLGFIFASIPLVGNVFDFLPIYVYMPTKEILSLITTLSSYLLIGLMFASRRYIGVCTFPTKRVLPEKDYRRRVFFTLWIPGLLTFLCIASLVGYLVSIDESVKDAALELSVIETNGSSLESNLLNGALLSKMQKESKTLDDNGSAKFTGYLFGETRPGYGVIGEVSKKGELINYDVVYLSEAARSEILNKAPRTNFNVWLPNITYLFFFSFVVATFMWFAITEYVQAERGITDKDLLENHYQKGVTESFTIDGVKDVGGKYTIEYHVEFNPDTNEILRISGPIVREYSWKKFEFRGIAQSADGSEKYLSRYSNMDNDKEYLEFYLEYPPAVLDGMARDAARIFVENYSA